MDDSKEPKGKRMNTHHITRGMIRRLRQAIEANPPGWLKEQVIADAVTRPMKIVMMEEPVDPQGNAPREDDAGTSCA
jgi:hypothetical protein